MVVQTPDPISTDCGDQSLLGPLTGHDSSHQSPYAVPAGEMKVTFGRPVLGIGSEVTRPGIQSSAFLQPSRMLNAFFKLQLPVGRQSEARQRSSRCLWSLCIDARDVHVEIIKGIAQELADHQAVEDAGKVSLFPYARLAAARFDGETIHRALDVQLIRERTIVAAAAGANSQAHGKGLEAAHVIAGHLQAFGVHGKEFASFAHLFSLRA